MSRKNSKKRRKVEQERRLAHERLVEETGVERKEKNARKRKNREDSMIDDTPAGVKRQKVRDEGVQAVSRTADGQAVPSAEEIEAQGGFFAQASAAFESASSAAPSRIPLRHRMETEGAENPLIVFESSTTVSTVSHGQAEKMKSTGSRQVKAKRRYAGSAHATAVAAALASVDSMTLAQLDQDDDLRPPTTTNEEAMEDSAAAAATTPKRKKNRRSTDVEMADD